VSQISVSRFRFHILLSSLLLVLSIVWLAPTPALAAQQEALEMMQRGFDKIQAGNAEDGLRDLEKAIEEEPALAQAHFYAGQASAQLQRWQAAYDYFVEAADLLPGFGEAHMQACRVAYTLEKFDDSWEQAILASQAGMDMQDAFQGLEARTTPPQDLSQRLGAPRVLIGNIDTSAILQQGTLLDSGGNFNPGADQSGVASADPFAGLITASSSLGREGVGRGGAAQLSEVQADLFEVRRRFGLELVSSSAFGVVPRVDIAQYVLFIKVDFIGAAPPPRNLRGFVKLFDAASEEEVYSRPLELRNITSVSDVRNDVARYVAYMEEWLRQQARDE